MWNDDYDYDYGYDDEQKAINDYYEEKSRRDNEYYDRVCSSNNSFFGLGSLLKLFSFFGFK